MKPKNRTTELLAGIMTFMALVNGYAAEAPFPNEAATNLIENGSFEDGIVHWSVNNAEITDQEAHTGIYSLYINPSDDDTNQFGGHGYRRAFYQTGPLKEGLFYRADAWVKAEENSGDKEKPFSLYTEHGGTTYSNPGDHDWEPVTHVFRARKSGSTRIYLMCTEKISGDFYVDDVSLRECEDPSLKPATFEDGTTIGVYLYNYGDLLPTARVVKGPTPDGQRYLSLPRGALSYQLSKPIKSGDVEFSFLVKISGRKVSVDLAGMRLELLPSILIRPPQGAALALGSVNPNSWYRISGTIHLKEQTFDLTVTDFEDSLGSFERKSLKAVSPIKSVDSLFFMSRNTNPKDETCLDDIYLGLPRKTK